jgi:hypothetical protein
VTAPAVPSAASAYQRLLIQTRARGFAAGRAEIARIEGAIAAAARDLEAIAARNAGEGVMAGRAEGLRREILAILGRLESTLGASGQSTINATVGDILRAQRLTAEAQIQRTGRPIPAGFAARFDALNTRVLTVLAGRRGGAARTYRSLIARNMRDAAPALDLLLEAGISRGQGIAPLARTVRDLLLERAPAGLPPRMGGLSSIASDARRIARSETMNALREANAFGMSEGGLVAASQWTINAAHPFEDDGGSRRLRPRLLSAGSLALRAASQLRVLSRRGPDAPGRGLGLAALGGAPPEL